MIYALLLAASIANSQDIKTGTEGISVIESNKISNLGKSTRDLLQGRYRQTGRPTFAGGFCFKDGSCMTSASTFSIVGSTTPFTNYVLKAGDTMTGKLNAPDISLTYGISAASAAYTFRVGIATAIPTQALTVVGTTYMDGTLLSQGSGGFGRWGSYILGAPVAKVRMSWGGDGTQASRDDPAVVAGIYQIASGAKHSWGSDVGEQMYFQPGTDQQGHLSLNWGNSAPRTPTSQVSEFFAISSRQGFVTGLNTTGDSKIDNNEGLAIETDGIARVLFGNTVTGKSAYSLNSDVDGNFSTLYHGTYDGSPDPERKMMYTTPLGVNIGTATFGLGATMSSFTITGALIMAAQSSVTLSGSNGNIVAGASITASGFFGNGSALTGIAGEANTYASSKTFTSSVSISSTAFIGVEVSTQAAGAAGASVTALCRTARTFATGGGCSCSGGVALTGVVNTPNCSDAGCQATGWICQEPGGTGGACSAYVVCSRGQ